MRRIWMLAASCAVLLIVSGCASTQSESGIGKAKVKVPEPEIKITQLSELPGAARYISGNMTVHYQVLVANHAKEPIVLTRLDLQTMGEGAYKLNPQSRPFNIKIAPDGLESAEFWAPAFIPDVTVYGANGPVTLRFIAQFDSPYGQ